ncbi:MAG: lipocalin family protein [Acidobacteria bacterium]|nr:lipocalin family protein [Acidobacteriota bacterium]
MSARTNLDYLWILVRTPQLDEQLYQQLLTKMAARGFETQKMIRTSHLTEAAVE